MPIIERLKNKISKDRTAKPHTGGDASHKSIKDAAKPANELTEEEKKIFAAVIKKPHVTEKTTALQNGGMYTFIIHPSSTKHQVKAAIEKLYGVTVTDVHTVNIPRKKRMRGRTEGWKEGHRKALVRIKEGQTIEISS